MHDDVILETNINRDDDGGLYAELVYNWAFQEMVVFMASIFKLKTTQLMFFYRPLTRASVAGDKLKIGFSDSTGQTIYGVSTIDVSKASVNIWFNFSSTILVTRAAPSTTNVFFIEFPLGSKGEFEFNLISCFPPTYKNRPNGARIDIAQVLVDLKPDYVRLPGGDDLEGHNIPERFIWNNTVGFLENRPGRRGTWTGYNTEGFGLIELLTFVEDIGAIAVLAVYAGYSLNKTSCPARTFRSSSTIRYQICGNR